MAGLISKHSRVECMLLRFWRTRQRFVAYPIWENYFYVSADSFYFDFIVTIILFVSEKRVPNLVYFMSFLIQTCSCNYTEVLVFVFRIVQFSPSILLNFAWFNKFSHTLGSFTTKRKHLSIWVMHLMSS